MPPRKQGDPPATAGEPPQTVPTPISTTTESLPQAGDPRRIGALLGDWLAIRLDEVDALVDEARDRAEAIPDRRSLMLLIGELTVRLHCVELAVDELRAAKR
jgi:hypothetical protein